MTVKMRASSFSWFFFKRRRVDYSLLMRIICPIVKCSIQKSIRLVADDDGQFSIVKYEQHWRSTSLILNCGQAGCTKRKRCHSIFFLALFLLRLVLSWSHQHHIHKRFYQPLIKLLKILCFSYHSCQLLNFQNIEL